MKRFLAVVSAAGIALFPTASSGAHFKYAVPRGTRQAVSSGTAYGASKPLLLHATTKKKKAAAITMKMPVTAYCHLSLGRGRHARKFFRQAVRLNGQGIMTSFGEKPRRGTIAADPHFFPRNTVFYVPGYGWGKMGDTGGAIKGHRLDVFMDTFREAQHWGRRKICVLVYTSNEN